MSTSLFQLLTQLLLVTASSLGAPDSGGQIEALVATEAAATVATPAAEQRARDRAARISLADPYYSFSRAKRLHKD